MYFCHEVEKGKEKTTLTIFADHTYSTSTKKNEITNKKICRVQKSTSMKGSFQITKLTRINNLSNGTN